MWLEQIKQEGWLVGYMRQAPEPAGLGNWIWFQVWLAAIEDFEQKSDLLWPKS